MDVHPTKNGIFIGIDPYPYVFIAFEAQSTLMCHVRRWPSAISAIPVRPSGGDHLLFLMRRHQQLAQGSS